MEVERFTSFDQFQPNDVIGGGISLPLQPKDFSAFRAILPLQDSLLVLQRSFARHLATEMGADRGTGLVIPLTFQATLNGQEVDRSKVILTRGKTPVQAVEAHANTYLMLRLNSDMYEVGWPEFDNGVRLISPDPMRLQRLRAAVLDIFCWASACADPKEFAALSLVIQETLRAALDNALIADGVRAVRPRSFDKYKRLVAQLDELVALAPTMSFQIDDLARRLGVSARTLQTAVHAVHGVGTHQYLRSKRLWAVRQQLVTRSSLVTVSAAARANGFWHMSEFARTYKAAFSETPSQTLARVRRP